MIRDNDQQILHRGRVALGRSSYRIRIAPATHVRRGPGIAECARFRLWRKNRPGFIKYKAKY